MRSALSVLVIVVLVLQMAGPAAAHRRDHWKGRWVRKLTNVERVERDRGRLRLHWGLVHDAKRHSRAMCRRGYLFHDPRLAYELSRHGWWSVGGENVGVGESIRDIHRAFMRSRPHRRNLLYRGYRQSGAGVVRCQGLLWVTVRFMG